MKWRNVKISLSKKLLNYIMTKIHRWSLRFEVASASPKVLASAVSTSTREKVKISLSKKVKMPLSTKVTKFKS